MTQRTFAVSFVALAGLGWGALTFAAIRDTPPASEASTVDFSLPTGWMSSAPADLAAVGYYRTGNCRPCHQLEAMRKPKTADWLVQHFVERKTSLTGPQQTQLAKFLLKLKADETEAYNAAPEFVTAGAMLFQSSHCGSCHQVNGVGNKVGPPLNGVGQHRNQEWLRDHFLDPKKMAPGTVMPAYKFKDDEMRNMINYLSTLE